MQNTSEDIRAEEEHDIREIDGDPNNLGVNSSLDLDGASVGECARGRDEDPLLDPSVVGQPRLAAAEVAVDLGGAHAALAAKTARVRSRLMEGRDTHLIPQTMRDWPRRQSPAAKTPSTLVW